MRDFITQIMHHITHILGFRYETFKNWRVYRNKNLNFNGLRNINEKTIDLWNGVKFKIPNTHYANIKNDIMSRKRNNRIPVFSSITLIILQRTRWYQINLSLCGCSLNGNCEYLRHAISIYINSNLNGDYNTCKLLQTKAYAYSKVLFSETNPIPIKRALYEVGLIDSDEVRLPLVKMQEENKKELQKVLVKYKQKK